MVLQGVKVTRKRTSTAVASVPLVHRWIAAPAAAPRPPAARAWTALAAALVVALMVDTAVADGREKIRIAEGRAEVVTSTEDVRTVAIAEPKIADAAVGSAKTVVVNAKAAGTTTLIVYNQSGHYTMYDVEVYVPNAGRQVALHVRVAEVNNTAKKELGFDWYGEGSSDRPWLNGFLQGGILTSKIAPVHADPVTNRVDGLSVGSATDGFVGWSKNNSDLVLQTTWKALEEKGDLRTLANSTLTARSGQKATFLSGGEIPIPIASGAAGATQTVTIEWKEFGVRLSFTPTVEEDNSITLDVAPEVSQIDNSSPLQISGYAVPNLISRKASTTVNLNPGEHLVIGGLKQSDKVKVVRRVPVLGHIPVLGLFFSNTRIESVDHDLLVVVSPEIIEAAATRLPALPTDRPQN